MFSKLQNFKSHYTSFPEMKFCKWVFPCKQQMDSTCVSWTWRTHLTNFTWGRHYLTGWNRCVTGGRRVIAVNTQCCGGRGQPNDCGHKYRRQVKVDFHWNQSGRPVQVPSLFFKKLFRKFCVHLNLQSTELSDKRNRQVHEMDLTVLKWVSHRLYKHFGQ